MKVFQITGNHKCLAILVTALVALLAVACGGAEAPAAPAPAAPAAPAQPPAPAPAAPAPAQPAAPAPVAESVNVPEPQSAVGSLVMIPRAVPPGVGLNRSQAPEDLMYWGVTEQLFRPEGDDLVGSWLAESWDLSSDLTKATVKIRSGVQFHQGLGELTAEDIAWSLNDTNAAITPTSIHGQAGDFAAFMEEAEASDDRTLVLNFSAPEPRWNTLLFNQAGDAFSVFSKKAFDQNGEEWMRENIIGTGPYQVEEWIRQDHANLEAVSDHWDKVPAVQSLRLVDVPETATRVAMMKTGEADWAEIAVREIPPLAEGGFKTTGAGRQTGFPVNVAGNYWEETASKTGEELDRPTMVHDIPWVGNPFRPDDGNNPDGINDMEQARLVRWGLATSIDRDLISESVYGGLANPYYIGMFHPIDPLWDDKWKVDYDKQKAEEFLDMAGFPRGDNGVRFDMPLYGFSTNRDWAETADAISGFFNEVGVETTVVKVAYAIVRPSLVGRTNTTPATQSCRSDVWVPWDWVRGEEETSLTRGGFGCHIESPVILDLVQKVAAEPDLQKRVEINNQLADYLYEQQLKIGVIALPLLSVYNPNSIQEWPMRTAPQGPYNSPELIVPAR